MKKIVFYIPAVLFAMLYGWLTIRLGIGSFSWPIIFVWISLFLVGGILLSKDKFWGGILGMLPGIHIIYMSTKYTGQAVSERLTGIVILIFYIICSSYIYRKNQREASKS